DGVLALVPVAVGLLAGHRILTGELRRLRLDLVERRMQRQRLDAVVLEDLRVPVDDADTGVVGEIEEAVRILRPPRLVDLELRAPDVLEVLVLLDERREVDELPLTTVLWRPRHLVAAGVAGLDHSVCLLG